MFCWKEIRLVALRLLKGKFFVILFETFKKIEFHLIKMIQSRIIWIIYLRFNKSKVKWIEEMIEKNLTQFT